MYIVLCKIKQTNLNAIKHESHVNMKSLRSNTVKPAHEVTSIKRSPVLKGHFFLVLS